MFITLDCGGGDEDVRTQTNVKLNVL